MDASDYPVDIGLLPLGEHVNDALQTTKIAKRILNGAKENIK